MYFEEHCLMTRAPDLLWWIIVELFHILFAVYYLCTSSSSWFDYSAAKTRCPQNGVKFQGCRKWWPCWWLLMGSFFCTALVSDTAIFVMKRDVKTNQPTCLALNYGLLNVCMRAFITRRSYSLSSHECQLLLKTSSLTQFFFHIYCFIAQFLDFWILWLDQCTVLIGQWSTVECR